MSIDIVKTIAVIMFEGRSIRSLQAKEIQRSYSSLWEMSEAR